MRTHPYLLLARLVGILLVLGGCNTLAPGAVAPVARPAQATETTTAPNNAPEPGVSPTSAASLTAPSVATVIPSPIITAQATPTSSPFPVSPPATVVALATPTARATLWAYPPPATQVAALTLATESTAPGYGYQVVQTYPHDPEAFTQGLLVDDNPAFLLEGTGQWGESSLRRTELATGEVVQSVSLPEAFFGEGLARAGDRLYQLTWKSGQGFIYDAGTFALLDTFTYPHEGWGITYDGQQLIVSDGTPTIRFWDLETLRESRRIEVLDDGMPVSQLNELEYVNGEIWANVWLTDFIVRIAPETGEVLGWIDLSDLLAPELRPGLNDVLNGIAYNAAEDRLFVTGKNWPYLFEIELVPVDAGTS